MSIAEFLRTPPVAASDDGGSKVMNNYNFRAPPEEAVVYIFSILSFS